MAGAGGTAPQAHVGEGKLLLELAEGGHDPLGGVAEHGRALEAAGVERVGPVTIAVPGDDPWQQYRALWAALRSALYEPASFLR